ncbi:MAG: hypothetical protein H7289_08400 [Mucilaginibacter sp.]|nr:hypothetical protein [Mucilaginibacter sp.]
MINYNNLYVKIENDSFVRLSTDDTGKLRDFLILKTPLTKRYAGYVTMTRDIEQVREAINHLRNQENPTLIQQSILFFSIVTYGKLFTSNQGNRPMLNFDDIFKTSDPKLSEEHNRIMNLRHEYVAHAGAEYDQCLVSGTIVKQGNAIKGIDVNSQLMHVVNMTPKLDDFLLLCNFIQEKIAIKSAKVWSHLQNECCSLSPKEIKKMAITPDKTRLYKMIENGEITPNGAKQYDFVKVEI